MSLPAISPAATAPAFVAGPTSLEASMETRQAMSQQRRYVILAILSLGMFLDILGFSSFFILLAPVSQSLAIAPTEQTWVITSFALTFAASLLFWGRVCDLFSPSPVFTLGFLGLGLLNLIISFLPDQYSFFTLRAISGICAAALVPSSYRIIVDIFDGEQLSTAFTIYGISGAIANSAGLLFGGAIVMIPGAGQLAGWRWYFRITAVLILPLSWLSFLVIPRRKPQQQSVDQIDTLRALDLPGIISALLALLLLMIGLTLGASYGFSTAKFAAPFALSWPCLGFCVWWERSRPDHLALIPASIFKASSERGSHNFILWLGMGLLGYAWFSLNYVPFAEIYTRVHHQTPIVAALRLLPQGCLALTSALMLTFYPQFPRKWPRLVTTVGLSLGCAAYLLFIFSGTQVGSDYYRYVLPGLLMGGFGMHAVFNQCNVGAMTSAPPHQSGLAGALLQTSFQLGSAVALTIQTGLWTTFPDSYYNFRNIQLSWWVTLGWTALSLLAFWIFYRPAVRPVGGASETLMVVAH